MKFRRLIINFFGAGADEPIINFGVSIDWLQQLLDSPEAFENLGPFAFENDAYRGQSASSYG
jgi:hypothetical protein